MGLIAEMRANPAKKSTVQKNRDQSETSNTLIPGTNDLDDNTGDGTTTMNDTTESAPVTETKKELEQQRLRWEKVAHALQEHIESGNLLSDLPLQVLDSEISRQFDQLFVERIPYWATKLAMQKKCDDLETWKKGLESDRPLYVLITSWAENPQCLEESLDIKDRRLFFARGLVARVLCDHVFTPTGVTWWLNKDTARLFSDLQSKFDSHNTGQGDPKSTFKVGY